MSETTIPRPEYPRPQFERSDWMNLNGPWEFDFDDRNTGLDAGWWREEHQLARSIVVPFPYPSPASGIGDPGRHEVMWYARTFELPPDYTGCQIWLHFGAVDEAAQLWLNGEPLGENRGGQVPFSFEVTGLLRPGRNRLTLRVEGCPGVASRESSQTRTAGIWQTVWLEPVSPAHIARLRITPEVAAEAVRLELAVAGASGSHLKLHARALLEGREVATAVAEVIEGRFSMELPLRQLALWAPEHPFLYDLELTLLRHGMAIDRVRSYFGMREIRLTGSQLLLNGRPLAPCLTLDAGWFPEGGPAAPSDAALRRDVELAKGLGFHGIRKERKVEEPRGLMWCDRLGLLVWSGMPDLARWDAEMAEAFVEEWARVVERDFNHPCIVTWAPFNERWQIESRTRSPEKRALVEGVIALTRALDGTRPIVGDDGCEHLPVLDIDTNAETPEAFLERYRDLLEELSEQEFTTGFCYAQLADSEQEPHGLLTTDRQPKAPVERIAALNGDWMRRCCERPQPPRRVLVLPTTEAIPLPPPSPVAPAPAPASPRAAGIPVPVRLARTR